MTVGRDKSHAESVFDRIRECPARGLGDHNKRIRIAKRIPDPPANLCYCIPHFICGIDS